MGPFLYSAKGFSSWGVDAFFNVGLDGKPLILASQIKGKLREALTEIKQISEKEKWESPFSFDLKKWLGREDKEGNYISEKGDLLFSDFTMKEKLEDQLYKRIRVNVESGTADEGALLVYQTPFSSGMEIEWQGTISFVAEAAEIESLKKTIKMGFKWITAFGANKGIGFGRLKAVNIEDENTEDISVNINSIPQEHANDHKIGLIIKPSELLLMGGVKSKQLYLESETVITGSVLKGSLASCIKQKLGIDSQKSISTEEPMLNEKLPHLAKYFSDLRFTHAFPTYENLDKRPTVIPLSTVEIKVDKSAASDEKKKYEYVDVALNNNAFLINKKPPAFQIDWKGGKTLHKAFGFASPSTLMRTRTAIDQESRRSKQEQLYTYQYLVPKDEEGNKISWLSNIWLPEGVKDGDKVGLLNELRFVIENWWDRMGKRDSLVNVNPVWNGIESSEGEEDIVTKDGKIIITLQSDALMLNPKDVITNSNLQALYENFWNDISGETLKLSHFFAHQKLLGGYLVHRYGKEGEPYYPYYLTAAGSVFVLELNGDAVDREKKIDHWKTSGLDAPNWAKELYGKRGEKLNWENCPYVPENGYGEIKVNLSWHWKK